MTKSSKSFHPRPALLVAALALASQFAALPADAQGYYGYGQGYNNVYQGYGYNTNRSLLGRLANRVTGYNNPYPEYSLPAYLGLGGRYSWGDSFKRGILRNIWNRIF